MKFGHIADCHLGAWSKRPELQELNIRSFEYTIDKCLEENVEFFIVAGDFFDVAFPINTDILSRVFKKLKEVNDRNIPFYLIPGSHDFSASGDSMLKILESAGLCTNLVNLLKMDNGKPNLSLFKDEKRNIILTGILGKRIGLEIDIIKNLDNQKIESEIASFDGFKIFIVHTAVSELISPNMSSEHMDVVSYDHFPKGFDYYPAGHIHEPKIIQNEDCSYAYSGCIFPNSFSEISDVKHGSFIIGTFDKDSRKLDLRKELIKLKEVISIEVDAEGKDSESVEKELLEKIGGIEVNDKIVTLKVAGTLSKGKGSDINFEHIHKSLNEKGCFTLLRNTHGLSTKEFEIEVSKAENVEDIEKEVISNFLSNFEEREQKDKKELINSLLKVFNNEKAEEERKESFSTRLVNEVVKTLNLEEKF